MNNRDIDELEAEEDVGELANQCRLLRTRIAELESVVADLRQARDEAWDEQERLRTCIAELEDEKKHLDAQLAGSRAARKQLQRENGQLHYDIDRNIAALSTEAKAVAELEAERDRLRENLDHHTRKAHRSDAQHWCQYRIGLEACRDSVEALARSTDTGADLDNLCSTCAEECGDPNECPGSKRECGHHCNCLWIHDTCCWCDVNVSDDGDIIPPTKPKRSTA